MTVGKSLEVTTPVNRGNRMVRSCLSGGATAQWGWLSLEHHRYRADSLQGTPSVD